MMMLLLSLTPGLSENFSKPGPSSKAETLTSQEKAMQAFMYPPPFTSTFTLIEDFMQLMLKPLLNSN